MATAKTGLITAWSFSRLNDYRKCPKFAFFKHVRKLKEPGSKAMDRGSEIDQMATDFLQGKLKRCPPELANFQEEFSELRKSKNITTQEQWAFTADWRETGWFDGDAWLRIKTDLYRINLKTNIMLLVDNKTGQERENHGEQVELYGLGGLLKNPDIAGVDARIWYLDSGVEKPETEKIYIHADLPRLKTYWLKQTKPMLTDRVFKEAPSNACNWCHFRKANNGPCKY